MLLTDEEKRELLLNMAQNLARFNDKYEPHFVDGPIVHSSPCIIKSTLKGRKAWSDGHIAMVYTEGDVHSQMPEWRAERWHEKHDSFDILPDAVLTSSPIRPYLYDDEGVWFENGAGIQRCFYDLFWVKHRNDGLRFEQDTENVNSVILAFDNTGLIGVVMPRSFESPERGAQILELLKLLIHYHEYSTDEPCDKCGSTQDVWLFAKNREIETDGIPICHWCYLDTEGFQEYLEKSFEEALASNPDEWEKTPDGKWRSKEKQ